MKRSDSGRSQVASLEKNDPVALFCFEEQRLSNFRAWRKRAQREGLWWDGPAKDSVKMRSDRQCKKEQKEGGIQTNVPHRNTQGRYPSEFIFVRLGLLVQISVSRLTGDTAKGDDVSLSVAA